MMSELNEREQTLVGLGAALASNCIPCIEFHIPKARRAGYGEAQIREAVEIADKVRRVPARLVLQTARSRIREAQIDATEDRGAGCACTTPGGISCAR
jgi:AhpD family alkylhydroperoxidase